ncbi:MAG: hypothetical protein ACI4DO_06875 [Roseburia sp.]
MSTETVNTPAPVVGADATQSVQQTPTQPDKALRFKNRAENQASKILAEIESMKKLSNKKYYTFTPEQITELFGAIQTALEETQACFTSDSPEKKKLFTFSK